jgi:hypothetical protein
MSNIQKTLESLQPYVIGIRYLEGKAVVDVVFKEGWTILDDQNILKIKGDDSMNYYMLYSETPNIGLDDLLAYVDKTIKVNKEREKKHDLLKEKVNELKEIFKKNSLSKLSKLKFKFEDDLVPPLNDFDLDIDETLKDSNDENIIVDEQEYVEEKIEPIQPTNTVLNYLDENGNPIELTEEEREILEEEARAERNRQLTQQRRGQTASPKASKVKVELPPRPAAVLESSYGADCDCGPDEACDKCIDSKGL